MNIERSAPTRSKPKVKSPILTAAVTVLFGLAMNFGVALKLGIDKDVVSDAHYYLQIAKSLAEGRGYSSQSTHWPNSPTMSRLPGWPVIVSLAVRSFPNSKPDTVMRILCLSMNSMESVLVFWLAFLLYRSLAVSFLSGTAYSSHPTGLMLAYSGDSETLFILLVTIGLLVLLLRPRSQLQRYTAFLMLGCSTLVRPNFVLLILFLPIIFRVCPRAQTTSAAKGFFEFMVCIALFLLPMSVWTVRNYAVSGQFPVLSTLSGATFYGANNSVVANNLDYWGYWIFADSIPGEVPMKEMAKTMTEVEVDRYYSQKGTEFVLDNLFFMPRLLLGKLNRAYIPIPFRPTWESYVASLFRWLLFAGLFLGIARCWKETASIYRVLFISILLVNVSTVLIFWGNARFAFQIEPFTLPFFGVGVVHFIRWTGLRSRFHPAIFQK